MSDFHDEVEVNVNNTKSGKKATPVVEPGVSVNPTNDRDGLSVEEKLRAIKEQQGLSHYLNIDPKDIPDDVVYFVAANDPSRLIELRNKFATFVPPERHPHLKTSLPFESQGNYDKAIPIGGGFLMQMEKPLFDEYQKINQQKVDASESNIDGLEGGGPANWRRARVHAF